MNNKKNLLIDYHHHFNFIEDLVNEMKRDFNVTVYKWDPRGEKQRLRLLKYINIIFCEWGAENAIWYSNNKRVNQNLYVRIHRWEIFTTHLFKITWQNVDKVIFITPEMERLAKKRLSTFHLLTRDNFDFKYYIDSNKEFINEVRTRDKAWQHFHDSQQQTGKVLNFSLLQNCEYESRLSSVMIYNYVKSSMFGNEEKRLGYEFNIGMMGVVPKLKRLDKAVDILKIMVRKDPRFKLYVLGKSIDDIPWLKQKKDEVEFYKKVQQNISNENLSQHVIFEKYTEKPHIWMQKIGYLLSVSDVEGSHQAVAEAMAAGTIPVIHGGALNQYKLDDLYPSSCCLYEDSVEPLCNKIYMYSRDCKKRQEVAQKYKQFAFDNFHINVIYNAYKENVL